MPNDPEPDDLRSLIGDKVPNGDIPAAWWISTDPEQLAAYDKWVADYDARREQIKKLTDSLGLEITDAYSWSGGGVSELVGFLAPTFMGHWNTELPEYRPIPEGWRIDKKKNYLVPLRKTKADRESQANKDFAAVRRLPNVSSYLKGMPKELWLPGHIYSTGFRRGEHCVIGYIFGDPDRAEKTDRFVVDTSIWKRQKLSALIALREEEVSNAE